MMEKLTSIICRFLFGVAFFLAGVAVLEGLFRQFGSTIIRDLPAPGRILQLSTMPLVFVIALQLREIKILLGPKD
jgi:hypothetical protein